MDLLLADVRLATMETGGEPYGHARASAIGFAEGQIAWIGEAAHAPAASRRLECHGRWLTPGLIDCHTHLVYAGNRAREFEMRLEGATYEAIAQAGGGILSTVRATRAASEEELVAQALPRISRLAAEGVTLVEVKSGYGLDLEGEMKLLRAARAHGLRVKLHAEQLSNQGGAALAAAHEALSADHLEFVDDAGVAAMARAGTVAVLLPGAFLYLRETQLPPVALLRQHGVRIAVASDNNPGTSPYSSLLLMVNLACTAFRLTPEEALAGVTRNAARALGVERTHGTLAVGKDADAVLW